MSGKTDILNLQPKMLSANQIRIFLITNIKNMNTVMQKNVLTIRIGLVIVIFRL